MCFALGATGIASWAEELPDIRSVAPDLQPPRMTRERPAPGKRVRQTLPEYTGTRVHHSLYLPGDWVKGGNYPVIVEYAGNGGYRNRYGDRCTGKVADCHLGYGISGGTGFIWLCLPFVSEDGKRNERRWWGDVEATVMYCRNAVALACRDYGGDPSRVFLAGFSRGAIACNYIGLHDDAIAALWRGFICHSHYDGVRRWGYPGDNPASAAVRLKRLGNRPQFIIHEGSVGATQEYLSTAYPGGHFSFAVLPYRNHTDEWILRNISERDAVRAWISRVMRSRDSLHGATPRQ